MAASALTRKLLWGRAASRCAICRESLVVDGPPRDTVIGEECHIVARNAGGPRWDPEYPKEHIDSYANLILLCGNHHKEVDDLPERYPASALYQTKWRHEQWVRTTLGVDGGAFPSPISDVLISRFPLPAVFGILVDMILAACKGVMAANPTFDVNERELALARRLQRRLIGLVPLLSLRSEEDVSSLTSFLRRTLPWALDEAQYVLPSADEIRVTRSSAMYKEALREADAHWDSIQSWLLGDPVVLHQYHELAVSEERWPLLGFTSSEAAHEALEPTTRTLFDAIGPFEVELLRALADAGEIDIATFERNGMPRRIIVDVFNRLARDHWASLDDGRIRATELSRRFIARELAVRREVP